MELEMKRSIENVTKSDETSQPAKIANQQSGSDALRSSSDTPENLEVPVILKIHWQLLLHSRTVF